MEYDGIAIKYPVNRPLTEEERDRMVETRVTTSFEPAGGTSSIAQTRLCLEYVDKYYGWKGVLSALFCLPFLFFSWQGVALALELSAGAPDHLQDDAVWPWIATGALGAFGALAFSAVLAWGIARESFTFTHYPVRLNRQNRTVYVFRPQRRKSILRIKWDEVFWHIRHNKNKQFGGYNWFLAGHVLAKDRKTVLETFSFGPVGGTPEEIYPFWEYVRRFMQDGPDAVQAPELYLPLRGRREGFWWGAQTVMFNTSNLLIAAIVLAPFTAPAALARWLCMLSNRVPTWPADIEAECGGPDQPLREPKSVPKPSYLKIIPLLAFGLIIDFLVLSWVLESLPMGK